MSDHDPPRLTKPDYAVGNFLLLVSEACDLGSLAMVDAAALRALSSAAHEMYRGVSIRGARVGEIVEAIRDVNAGVQHVGGHGVVEGKLAAMLLFVVKRVAALKAIGVDVEIFDRLRILADAAHEALVKRGATAAEIVAGLRTVRREGSILADLPSIQKKLRERGE
jgi:hypothetical protein